MFSPKSLIKSLLLFCFVFSSVDYGQTGWFQQPLPSTLARTLYFIDQQTGWVAGHQFITKTTNGGLNWDIQGLPLAANSIIFVNSQTGFVAGQGSTMFPFPIYKTTNSGQSWNPVNLISTTLFYRIFFLNETNGWLVGDSSTALRTNDGGTTWQQVNVTDPDIETFVTIRFLNLQTGWIVSSYSTYKTTNAGNNWTRLNRDTTRFYLKLIMVDENTGYCSGMRLVNGISQGRAFKTTNSGISWFETALMVDSCWTSGLTLTDVNNVWVSTTNGKIFKTTNGGNSWVQQHSGPENWLLGLQMVNSNVGYATTYSGYVLKTLTGGVIGINPVDPTIPKSFLLHQNYPNPFNPTTKIKFEIPKSGKVEFAVFDVLGNLVSSSSEEIKSPGIYEIDFDGSSFSSGVYFYKLRVGDFIGTKKMVLVK